MMDDFTYRYAKDGNGNFINNRLLHVNDSQTNKSIDGEDIDDQEIDGIAYSQGNPYSQNYAYDKIGNLIADKQEEIAEIKWNVQGKVTDIIRKAGSDKANLHFKYDAMGNRVSKSVVPKNVADADTITTYYVRDAQGNVMAVYERKHFKYSYDALFLQEQHLYGSSRLGMKQMNYRLYPSEVNPGELPTAEKHYELTNHLGNVLAVVSDKKLSNNLPDIKAVYDYYPFGMQMPNRSLSGDYRYGFNGAEKINEYSGTGRIYDLGSRIYNPNIIRQFTPDPREKDFPWQSTYAYYANSPIWKIDYKGEGPTDNSNIQEAEQKADDINSQYELKGNDRFTVERYTGEDGLEGAKINHPDGSLYQDFPGTPENQGSKISNTFHWIANYTFTEGDNNAANSDVGTKEEAIAGVVGTAVIFTGGIAAAFYPEIMVGLGTLITKVSTTVGAIETGTAATGVTVGAGAAEGVTKGSFNAPPDTPYLFNIPLYTVPSDIMNFITTVILDNYKSKPNEQKK